jgi:hypothetical protein
MHTPPRVIEMMNSIADMGEGRTMEQLRADFLDVQPDAVSDVAGRLARIEAKLDATAQACEKMLANTEALVGHNPDSPPSLSSGGRMLTKQEVARCFQITTRTLDRWRALGYDLGEIVIQGTVRFDPGKVNDIVRTNKIKKHRRTKLGYLK